MAIEDHSLPRRVIKHRGMFSFSGLMQGIKGFFDEKGYNFFEPKHKFGGGEAEIEFYGEKDLNLYTKLRIDVKMKLWEMNDVEVVQNGQKLLMNNARVMIAIEGKLEFDKKKFGKGKLKPVIQDFYHRFIFKEPMNEWEKELFMYMDELTKIIKEQLKQES